MRLIRLTYEWGIELYLELLNNVSPIFNFYTPWKLQKTSGFVMISGGLEMEYWVKMG